MHFAFTEEQAMIAETAKAFFGEAATSERTRRAMAGDGIDHELWASFAREVGLAGVALPEAFGGSGLGMVEAAIVAEAAGATVAALPLLASSILAASAIAAGGREDQKAEWLPALASAERLASYVVINDAEGLAPHGGAADLFVVEIDGVAAVIERGAAGLEIEPLPTMDATRPLARVRLSTAALITLGDGAAAARAANQRGAVAIAADSLGGAQAALDRTVAYTMERVQFGRPVGSFQAVKHRLADMMVLIEQARSAVYWAACAVDEQAPDAALAVHSAKAFACDAYADCAAAMIQLHGGIGFTWEHDAHLYFKRAQANRNLLGTPDWHRDAIAALVAPLATAA